MSLNVLSLFSGIGGLELGLERAGMTTVGQVEIDPYCRRVLAKHWPDVPRHDDVRTAAEWWQSEERPTVDVICGGFPCQDISAAGRRAGIISGERSGLWSWMADTVRRIRPRYVLVENVPRILVRDRDGIIPIEVVAADMAALGYDLRWDCVPAAAVGAAHLRDRWFGVAYAQRDSLRFQPIAEPRGDGQTVPRNDGAPQPLAHAASGRRPDEPPSNGQGQSLSAIAGPSGRTDARHGAAGDRLSRGRAGVMAPSLANADCEPMVWPAIAWRERDTWPAEPDVGRVADGVPARVDRLRALGNAVVPQVAEHVGRLIVEHASAA